MSTIRPSVFIAPSMRYWEQLTNLFNGTYYIHGFSVTLQQEKIFLNLELHDVDGEGNICIFDLDFDYQTCVLYKTSRGKNFEIDNLMMSYDKVFRILFQYTLNLFEALTLGFEPYSLGEYAFYPYTSKDDMKIVPSRVEGHYDVRVGYDDLTLTQKGITPVNLKYIGSPGDNW